MNTKKTTEFNREKTIAILDRVILTGLAIYVFILSIGTTTFMFHIPEAVTRTLLICLAVVTVIKFFLSENDSTKWASIPVAAVYLIACFSTGYEFMAFLGVFTVALLNIHYKKVMAAFIIPVSVSVFTSMFASLCGAVSNYVKVGEMLHSSWGSCYHTELASALLFLLVFFWVFLKGIPDVLFIIPGVVVLGISIIVTGSKTTTTLAIIFLAFIIYKILEDKFIKKGTGPYCIFRLANALVRFIFPVLLIFMVVMLFLYRAGNTFAIKYDEIFSHRLVYAANMLGEWGIKPFGNYFDMAGNGWSTFDPPVYTFIDSSYLMLLIRYGLVTTLFVSLIWVWMSDKVLRSGNRRMAFAMVLIALNCLSEQHFMELNYNILLVMPFAFLDVPENNTDVKLSDWLGEAVSKKFRTTQLISLVAGTALLLFFMPMVFSYYRTIFNGYGMTDGNEVRNSVAVFVISFATLLIMAGFIWSFSKLVANDALENAISKRYLLLTILSAVIIMAAFMICDSLVNKVYRSRLEYIAEESSVISNITAYADGKVYVDRFPEAYKKQFAGIDRSFLDGEDIARLNDVTVIVDEDFESPCFEKNGFSYLKISDRDAIYTNDSSVTELLKKEGYELSAYNNAEHDIDVEHVAALDGHTPPMDLHEGNYEVTFELELGDNNTKVKGTGAELGDIGVSSYW